MKFIKLIPFLILLFFSCTSHRKESVLNNSSNRLTSCEISKEELSPAPNFSIQSPKDVSDIFSGYKCIISFSKKIGQDTGLILSSYGVNHNLAKNYPFQNEVVTITAHYILKKTQKDTISLEQARQMIVSLISSIIESVNSDPEIRPFLEIYPINYDLLETSICYKDENYIDLGTGISQVYFHRGKIKYEHYDIYEYRSVYPARGKHYFVHEETYPEALAIIQKSGA